MFAEPCQSRGLVIWMQCGLYEWFWREERKRYEKRDHVPRRSCIACSRELSCGSHESSSEKASLKHCLEDSLNSTEKRTRDDSSLAVSMAYRVLYTYKENNVSSYNTHLRICMYVDETKIWRNVSVVIHRVFLWTSSSSANTCRPQIRPGSCDLEHQYETFYF